MTETEESTQDLKKAITELQENFEEYTDGEYREKQRAWIILIALSAGLFMFCGVVSLFLEKLWKGGEATGVIGFYFIIIGVSVLLFAFLRYKLELLSDQVYELRKITEQKFKSSKD